MESRIVRRTAIVATALFALPLALTAQEDELHRAYFLHHEEGRLEEALKLYEDVASNRRASTELRERARRLAAEVHEDLIASDLTRLVPGDPILYAACMDPGRKLNSLLDQLGLLTSAHDAGTQQLGISPLLLEGALGLRGAALAVTDIDPSGGPPEGVLILHAGDMKVVRGLIDTAVSMGGQPTDAIEGHPTWTIEEQGFLTTTSRLVIVSGQRDQIEGVLARLDGDESDSLASSGALDESLAVRDGLLSFCIRAEPVMPMIQGLLYREAQNDPELAMALTALDVGSLRSLSGLIDVDDEGVSLEASLRLADGHRNLAFNLLRMPNVDRGTLELVPKGAAFFVAGAVNPKGEVPAAMQGSHGEPVVTAMDFGREIFGNLVDYAIFGLPPSRDANAPVEAAVILRSNDVQRSRAIWDLVFAGATQFADPDTVSVAGHSVQQHRIEGFPIYLGSAGDRVVIASSRGAMARALDATSSGASILDDPFYADGLDRMGSATKVIMANPGRCMRLGAPLAGGDEGAMMEQLSGVFDQTLLFLGVQHSATSLGVRARLSNLPDIGPLVTQAIRQQHGDHRFGMHASAPAQTVAVKKHADPEARVRELVRQGDHAGARQACLALLEEAPGDAKRLNNFAWALLTDDAFGEAFDDLALALGERAVELSPSSWQYLDTLALAAFRTGDAERAVALERRCLELVDDKNRAGVREALARFEAGFAGVAEAQHAN